MNLWSFHPPILGYHRVGTFKGDHVPTVSPETFERQLRFLGRYRYRVLSVRDMAEYLDRGESVPGRSVAITFDDGYEETFTVAWPILKRFGFPAAVFVTPTEVGLPGFATWDQIIAMGRDGMVVGCVHEGRSRFGSTLDGARPRPGESPSRISSATLPLISRTLTLPRRGAT